MGGHLPLANMAARHRLDILEDVALLHLAEASLPVVVDSAAHHRLDILEDVAEALPMVTGGVVVAREGEALVAEEGSVAEEEGGRSISKLWLTMMNDTCILPHHILAY